MDDLPWSSLLSSTPFTIIGPQGSHFYAHADLLAKISKVLAVEINGQMCEAATRVIHIKDIDDDLDDESVMRFLEFAYRGDYQVPSPDIEISPEDVGAEPSFREAKQCESNDNTSLVTEPPIAEEDNFDSMIIRKKGKKIKKDAKFNGWAAGFAWEEPPQAEPPHQQSKQEQLWSKFCEQAHVRKLQPWEPRPNSDPCEDYSRVFLCHARLYVFSNRYECETLRDLCLQKLRLQLSRFTLHRSRYSDITKLVQYSYAHTPDLQNGSDKLRSLVSDYVICHIEKMCTDPGFFDSLENALARDLIFKLLGRLA